MLGDTLLVSDPNGRFSPHLLTSTLQLILIAAGTGFTPIVNWPEVAILGVSRSQMKPLWDPGKEAFVPRLVMPFSLTYDHRLIDGADAARFCRHLAGILEDPLGLALA